MRFRNDLDPGFSADIYSKARKILSDKNEHRYADKWLIGKSVILAGIFLASYLGIFKSGVPPWENFLCAVIAGTTALLLSMNVGRDAAHDCFVRSAWGNRLLQRISFTLLGVDAYLWKFRHAYSHHPFPNVNGCDIDIDQNPFFRLSPNQPSRYYFRWQHIYAPLVYCLVTLYTVFIEDFMYLYQRQIANLKNIKHPSSAHIMFYVSKIAFVTIMFVLPVCFTAYGFKTVVLGYLAVSALVSLVFIFLLIGTHFSDGAIFPEVLANGTIEHSQAVHAVESSLDWYPQSRIAGFLTGGSNCHAAHHLFPRLSHRHYRTLTPVIEETARKYGLRYSRTSFRGLVASHVRFLRAMAKTERGPSRANVDTAQ